MKIATITCHRAYNYGAVLQAYALEKYLEKDNNEVEIIDYYPTDLRKSENKTGISKIVRDVLRILDFKKSEKVFGNFIKKNLKITKRYRTLESLKNDLPKDDIFIVGSDQVWNCNMRNGKDDTYFLTFVPTSKIKASYAASIAMDSLNFEQKNRFRNLLSNFSYISVREKTATKLLVDSGVKNVEQVLDPVYLLDKEEWDKLADKSRLKLDEKYILVYGFKRQKNLYEYAKKLAKEKNCKLYSINTNFEDHFLGMDKYFWNANPEDFVNLVRNAEAVITNSFHGLSFSIIYKKCVHQFTKNGTENSRMIDLLNELGLINRLVKNDSIILDDVMDYEKTYNIINYRKKESMDFLKKIYQKGER